MRAIAIIPARMSSGRFPGKPLSKICGFSMIGHCFRRVSLSSSVSHVFVATPDTEVAREIERLGGGAIVTPEFDMCNDRVAWAYGQLKKSLGNFDLVVNVQGDQPLVYPDMIDTLVGEFERGGSTCITLVEPCETLDDFYDLNRVKVLFRESDGGLIYMSRAPIPSPKVRDQLPDRAFKHVAIIGFSPETLDKFINFQMTYNEQIEGIDYNRVLEMGEKMRVVVTSRKTDTVDTPNDLKRVRMTMESDPLWLSGAYLK
jgi:3-deoxy-manno-octulosonate cytidylyltransferase (CMP-KDO synthetase)